MTTTLDRTTDRSVDTGLDAPSPAEPTIVPPPPPNPDDRWDGPEQPSRRIRIPNVTSSGAMSLFGSALAAISLTWVVYQRLLPLSGALGFWVCTYVVFLGVYAGVCASQWPMKVVTDNLVRVVLATAALAVLYIVVAQIGYVIVRGWSAIKHLNFFTETMALTGPLDPLTSGGMVNALVGSLEQLGIATMIGVPLGVLAALYLVEVGGPLARPVRTIVEAMTALPEIIAGLFVYAFVVLTLGIDRSGLAAAFALTVMMIPIVTRTSEVILRLVPHGLREASYALGASQVKTVFTVVLPTARSGLATAVILAMARAVGETSPVLLTAGFTAGMNADPTSGPQTSLPLYIFSYVRYPQASMVSRAFGAALALMVMVLILFTLARLIGGKAPGEITRRQRRRMHRDDARVRAERLSNAHH